tara:strand:+ start:645 stop:3044 length:2400 start_codon:yes stop_codon:yes gene_type:complete
MAETPRPSNVDKALIEAPLGGLTEEEQGFANAEDEMRTTSVDVVIQRNDDGTEIVLEGEEETEQEIEELGREPDEFFDNLIDSLSDKTISSVKSYVMSSVQDDKSSRDEWSQAYTKGLKLLGLRYQDRTQPFAGASGVTHPLLNEAVTQFQAQAYKELLPSTGPVTARIIGVSNPEIEKQAQRVQEYMNYQIMYGMEEYESEFDQMLYFIGLAGSAFKKVYFDDVTKKPVSKFVPAEDVLVPYTATDLRTAERITHVVKMSKNELRKMQLSGFYADVKITEGGFTEYSAIQEEYDRLEGIERTSPDEEVTLYECHCSLDLEEFPDIAGITGENTEVKLPYVVTVCDDMNAVLRISRNYRQDDPVKASIGSFVQYKFTPGLGFYGFGLVHLLGNLSRTATSTLRQLIDAGTLANLPSGFKAKGVRIADQGNPLHPGEWRDIDVPGGDIRSGLIPLPYKEPSATLFQLMGFVVDAAQRFIGTTDISVGDSNEAMPVGTTIALLERGSRIVSAVHKRMYASMKIELKMLSRLFAEDPAPYPYDVGEDAQIKSSDFDSRIDILPVSDPNIFSMSQRVVLAQEQLKLATADPDMHNMYEAYTRVYQALGVQNIDEILKPQPTPEPTDPATENQEASNAANGQGELKAFPEQDHQAHIKVHMGYMESGIAQQQTPVLLTLEKHIYDHLGLQAQMMAEQQAQQMGIQDPAQMAALVAQIQAQIIEQHQETLPPANKGDDDPLIALKERELDLKEQDQRADQMYDAERLEFEEEKNARNMEIQNRRIDSTEDIAQLRARIALQRSNK